jgi:hypothetical protein
VGRVGPGGARGGGAGREGVCAFAVANATRLHNIIIFTPVIYVGHSIIVEFGFFVDDLLNNKSPRGLLNRQNPFLWYELISHRMDLWKTENNNYDILENKLKH